MIIVHSLSDLPFFLRRKGSREFVNDNDVFGAFISSIKVKLLALFLCFVGLICCDFSGCRRKDTIIFYLDSDEDSFDIIHSQHDQNGVRPGSRAPSLSALSSSTPSKSIDPLDSITRGLIAVLIKVRES
jgi:hypothetical protein